jgi:hypothetical protein
LSALATAPGDCVVGHGFRSKKSGGLRDLGSLPGTDHTSFANSINAENGNLDPLTGFPEYDAVLWTPNGTIKDLGTLGGNLSLGVANNNAGEVVGGALNTISDPWWAVVPLNSNPNFLTGYYFFPGATQSLPSRLHIRRSRPCET